MGNRDSPGETYRNIKKSSSRKVMSFDPITGLSFPQCHWDWGQKA